MIYYTLRKYLLAAMIIIIVGSGTVQPGQAHAPGNQYTPAAYAPGRVLVQFQAHTSMTSANASLSSYGAWLTEELGPRTFVASVPVGQEEVLVKQLQEDPNVRAAMLDRVLTMPPLQPLDPAVNDHPEDPSPLAGVPAPQLSQSNVLTETLRMSTIPAGPALPENTLPTESPQAYVVFEYAGLAQEPLRIQVYALDVAQTPVVVFDTIEIFDGSGTATVVVPAATYFSNFGTFPIGDYLTLLYESVGPSWRTIGSVTWHVSTRPNDHWFLSNRYQWYLHNVGRWGTRDADIDAPEAWDVTTGSEDVTIAIVSSGVVMDHPDLKNKIWRNPAEIPDNGLDDDGNGYIDDVHGYEFFDVDDNPDPTDDIGWGTFAAGIAAAETNNEVGMAGVSWGARIMPIKVVRLFVTATAKVPFGYVSDLVQGIHYAADNGARVIFVAPILLADQFENVEILREAITYATSKGSLVIGVAGDQGQNLAIYPALFPQVLSVGATDFNDELGDFSNFGLAVREGLVAPGKLVLSTCMASLPACVDPYPLDTHGQTAWAAAQVAGVASLVWSVNPQLTPEEVRARIRETADDLGPVGPDQLFGYGRLNAGRAVRVTRHLLHLDVPELFFLVDDRDEQVCRSVRNSATGPFSWSARENVDWLRVNGPIGTFTPSHLEVCVIREALQTYGKHTATLTILSTIDTQTEPVNLPVTAEYVPRKFLFYVPMLAR